MRTILIDPYTRTITEVDYNGNYQEIYGLIEAQMFDVARIKNGDGIFVDDGGLLNNPTHFFYHSDYHTPLTGKGLIIGCNEEGESVSCKSTMEETMAKVRFANIFEVRAQLAEEAQ